MCSTVDATCQGTLMWPEFTVRGEVGKGLRWGHEELGKQEFPWDLSVSK